MSTPESSPASAFGLSPAPADQPAVCADLVAALQECAGKINDAQLMDEVPDRAVQDLLTMAVQLYVAKRETGDPFPPFNGEDLTATEVVVTTTNLLKAANLEVFELTMWNGFGTM